MTPFSSIIITSYPQPYLVFHFYEMQKMHVPVLTQAMFYDPPYITPNV